MAMIEGTPLKAFGRRAKGSGAPWRAALWCVAVALASLLSSCAGLRPKVPRSLNPAASNAFQLARASERGGDREVARTEALRALELEPNWVAPRRFLDDLAREGRWSQERLAEYAERIARNPDDAGAWYLAGRLLGPPHSVEFFERAAEADPNLAWAQHGLAWTGAVRSLDVALQKEKVALELGRDGWERSYFKRALAALLVGAGEVERAAQLLESSLTLEEVDEEERTVLAVQLAQLEIARGFGPRVRTGEERAIDCITKGQTTPQETRALISALLDIEGATERRLRELISALGKVDSKDRFEWMAKLYALEAPGELALEMIRASGGAERLALEPRLRAARFAAGQRAEILADWLQQLPREALGPEGLPRDMTLRNLVLVARSAEGGGVEQNFKLGDVLMQAGWFQEARGLAQSLATVDLDRALELDRRASAGRNLVDRVVELVRRLDASLASNGPNSPDLEELLAEMQPAFDAYRAAVGSVGETPAKLTDSPRLRYGPFASIVHPGPRYSASDQALGLGQAGKLVEGFAAEWARLGRFAVFGEAPGVSGPDGTVLRRLFLKRASGTHLGIEWSGTVAWCEGADLESRPGRRGARIGGAALHEGYWIDVETLRGEVRGWRRLLVGELGSGSGLERALNSKPLALEHAEVLSLAKSDRSALIPLMGESDRLRLAILKQRKESGLEGDLVSLDELLEATAIHEEGHLCERTRFLPLRRNLWRLLRFFAACGFSPARVEEQLEYRAQLVALCATRDPRIPLADVLSAAEGGPVGITPHAGAYVRLLKDFLIQMERVLSGADARAGDGVLKDIDRNAFLAHQIHRLDPEEVRAIALELARSEFGDGVFATR